MQTLQYLLIPFTQPFLLVLLGAGVFAGVYIGAIPGLSATMAVSLLVSFTFGWETNNALALMMGVFIGAVYGGSRSAILLNIPGAPAAVATGFDGYPLAQRGEAGRAMGVATTQSVIGTLLGVLALGLFAPLVSKLALQFISVDYLLLAVMGMMMVGSLGGKSVYRGLLSASIGVLIGTIGMDSMTAVPRFTFGNTYLLPGMSFVVGMIGLFGVSEALVQVTSKDIKAIKQDIAKIIPSLDVTLKHLPLTLRSAVLGIIVGALPGAGGDIAALLSYDQAKRTIKNPKVPFGQGAIEGIIAPETANNAAIGGAFIPMLTLGIPGDAVTAIMIGALTIHGLKPGPNLMTTTPDLFYLIVSLLFIGSFFLLFFGLTGIKIFAKIVEVPKGILLPIIIILSVVGCYAINNSLFDIFWMLGFGVFGYFMKIYDYPTAPAVLGIILTKLLEENYRRWVMLNKSVSELLSSIYTSPITIILLLSIIIMFTTQTQVYKKWKAKKDAAKSAA